MVPRKRTRNLALAADPLTRNVTSGRFSLAIGRQVTVEVIDVDEPDRPTVLLLTPEQAKALARQLLEGITLAYDAHVAAARRVGPEDLPAV